MTRSRAALTFVLLTVFIDSLGFGIIIPSLPSVIMSLTGQTESLAATWSGYLMAVYALLQFFVAPIPEISATGSAGGRCCCCRCSRSASTSC